MSRPTKAELAEAVDELSDEYVAELVEDWKESTELADRERIHARLTGAVGLKEFINGKEND